MKSLNSSTNTIWRYNSYYKQKIDIENQIFLQNKATNLEEFGRIWLKREDKSTIGSHKFRPLTYQVACALDDGQAKVTISSSGNAAIALSHLPIQNYIFISPNTPEEKKTQINTENSVVIESSNAMRFSNYFSKKTGAIQLRPSKDDNAIEGYKSLGFELFEQNKDIDAVFMFISSGASLLGIYEAYAMLLKEREISKMPALHAVIGNDQEDSLAGVCAHTHLRRRKEIMIAIANTSGKTWDVTNQELVEMDEYLDSNGVETSYEGIAAYTACKKSAGYKNPVVICSGKRWQLKDETKNFKTIESFEELDELISKL